MNPAWKKEGFTKSDQRGDLGYTGGSIYDVVTNVDLFLEIVQRDLRGIKGENFGKERYFMVE